MVRVVILHSGNTRRIALIQDGQPPQPRKLPAEYGRRPRDAGRYRATVKLLDDIGRFREARRGQPAARLHAGIGKRLGTWAKIRRLSVNPRALRRYRRRVDPYSCCFDGNLDRRGGAGRLKPRGCSEEAWQCFCRYVGDPSIQSSLCRPCRAWGMPRSTEPANP